MVKASLAWMSDNVWAVSMNDYDEKPVLLIDPLE